MLLFAVLIEQTAILLKSTLWNHPVMPTTAGVIVIVLAASLAGRARAPQAAPA